MFSRLLKYFFITTFVLVFAVVMITWLALDREPSVVVGAHYQIDDADSVTDLLRQAKQINRRRHSAQNVVLSEQQVNSLMGLMQRALPNFSGASRFVDGTVSVDMSYRLAYLGRVRYINLNAKLVSANRIRFERIALGALPIPESLLFGILVHGLNWHTGSDLGDRALEQIAGVVVQQKNITIALRPMHDFIVYLNDINNGMSGNDDDELKQRVRYYLAFLAELEIPQHRPGLTLTDFLRPLFARAYERGQRGQPTLENASAILALAVYTGHHRLANLIGDVQPYEGKVVMPRYRPMTLKRTDLTQHFIISAALKVLSQQGISAAIGEFKELMDRGEGGSGFSFPDLAADLAGIEFAMLAMQPDTAELFQLYMMSAPNTAAYFPSIDGLPEGISKSEFSQQYRTVEDEAYLSVVREIQNRIHQLPLVTAIKH